MTPQTELMEKIVSLAKEYGVSVVLSELSSGKGIYAELTPGRIDTLYYNKTAIRIFPILFIAKDANQKACLEQLSVLSNAMQKMSEYPKTETFQWLDAETVTEPNRIGRDEDGTYLYTCVIECKIYY